MATSARVMRAMAERMGAALAPSVAALAALRLGGVSPGPVTAAVAGAAGFLACALGRRLSGVPAALVLPDLCLGAMAVLIARRAGLDMPQTVIFSFVSWALAMAAIWSVARGGRHRSLDLVPLPVVGGLIGGTGLAALVVGSGGVPLPAAADLPAWGAALAGVSWPTAASWPALLAAAPALALAHALGQRAAIRQAESSRMVDLDPARELAAAAVAGLALLPVLACPVGLATRPAQAPSLTAIAGAGAVLATVSAVVAPPQAALGFVLMMAGGLSAERWLWRIWQRGAMLDRLVLAAVAATTLAFGPAQGFVLGSLAAVGAFAFAYSRSSPVRARHSGDTLRARVDHTPAENSRLAATAGARVILICQGYLFFGTADQLLGHVRTELARRPACLLLDMSGIDGADGSAAESFARLAEEVDAAGARLILAGMAPAVAHRLLPVAAPVTAVATLDDALDLAESWALDGCDPPAAAVPPPIGVPTVWQAGEVMLSPQDRSDTLLILTRGGADVTIASAGTVAGAGTVASAGTVAGAGESPAQRARRVGPDAMLGEIGYFLRRPRTATVRATGPTEAVVIDRAAVTALEASDPAAARRLHEDFAQRLARRLTDKDQLIAHLLLARRG